MTRAVWTPPVMAAASRKRIVFRGGWGLVALLAPWLVCAATGCTSLTPPWKKADPKLDVIPQDTALLTTHAIERDPGDPAARAELEAAKVLFEEKKYAQAEKRFHALAQAASHPWWDVTKVFAGTETDGETEEGSKKHRKKRRDSKLNSVREEAQFLEAECQRLQRDYREAVDTYTKLLIDYPHCRYTQKACQGMFEIAHYWLEPTRRQMDEYYEQIQGKRSFVMPAVYFHVAKDMPLMDAEGHALNILNSVRLHDLYGPLGEKSLLYLGTIHFYRKDYNDADYYFGELYNKFPNSKDAAKALKQSVICKQLATGGTEYDLRKVEESKKLLMTGQASYSELSQDTKWVTSQLSSINVQQADRDYKVAEFYLRTGHPGAAYFYFELVRRRYAGTQHASKATKRMDEIRARVEKEKGAAPPQAPEAPPHEPGDLLPPPPTVNPPPPGPSPAPPSAGPPPLVPRTLPPELRPGNP